MSNKKMMIERRSQLLRCLHLGAIVLCALKPTNAIINETFRGYLFTIIDSPDSTQSQMTKDQAKQWCQNNNNTLAEIRDSQTQDIVDSFINKTSGQGLGIRDMFTNGVRTQSPTSWMWVNGQQFIVGQGSSHQQDSTYAFGYLLLDQTGLSFIADLPTYKKSYICEGLSYCNGGFGNAGRCYKSFNATLSWFDARNECLNGGGDLASFDFVNDQQSFNSLNGSWITAYGSYWIGVRRQWWTWQGSNSEIKYTNWQNDHPQPTLDCLCLLPPGDGFQWSDCDCNGPLQFICMRDINGAATTSTVKSSVPTTGTTKSGDEAPKGLLMTTPSIPWSTTSGTNNVAANSDALRLGVGLGVGIGGSLIVIVIIVVVVLLLKKRQHKNPGNSHQSQKRLQTPDLINTEQYAEVQRSTNTETTETNVDGKANIVYSELSIATIN